MEFYTQIHTFFPNENIMDMSDEKKKEICDLFGFRLGREYRDYGPSSIFCKIEDKRKRMISQARVLRIVMDIFYDEDEWFYIKMINYLANPLGGSPFKVDLIYKCDQWDGLIKCIENEIVIKYIPNEN